ncbi:polyisoprenoid-binding protein (plasmid) [Azospirillum humicireducens]|uniref:Polyisoprenoid-binding protein n=1 Tax=Azospirillum humicireducens TaxID=1226968 RepID=A0A2R4VR25_9PROT|nr:YceI family protein [Azospirillum humicireducens]AWB06898.1 polyisoprenoid-binding protein [Azospirillum humicireducens]
MKKTLFAAALFVATAAGSLTPAFAAPVSYKIDPAHTAVAFIVNHIGFSNVIGRFNTVGGDISFDKDAVEKSTVNVTIDAASIDTNHAKRDEHLRSPDFFNAKEFPKLTFKSTKIEKTGDKTGKLHGDLTMLGVTKPVVLDVTFNKDGVSPASKLETAGFSARGTVKRTDFGMKYGAPAVGDDIQLLIEIEAVKS